MITDAMKAEGWIEHDGRHTPSGSIFVKFRDGISLSCAFPAQEWVGRFEWWGARTKKDNDIIAYRPETKP